MRLARVRGVVLLPSVVLALVLLNPALALATAEHDSHKTHAHGKKHAAGDAHGGGHHESFKDINWFSFDYGPGKTHKNPPIGWTIVNFAILVFLLVKLTGKPMTGYLKSRAEQIERDLAEAAKLRKEAEGKLEEIDNKVYKLDDDVANIKLAVAEDAQAEKQRIIEAAQREAETIVEAAERTLNVEIERAKRRLEVSAVDAALKAAELILKKEIKTDDLERLRSEYKAQIEQVDLSGGNN
jgi:F-type H+-transporting ATPase subunit b